MCMCLSVCSIFSKSTRTPRVRRKYHCQGAEWTTIYPRNRIRRPSLRNEHLQRTQRVRYTPAHARVCVCARACYMGGYALVRPRSSGNIRKGYPKRFDIEKETLRHTLDPNGRMTSSSPARTPRRVRSDPRVHDKRQGSKATHQFSIIDKRGIAYVDVSISTHGKCRE